MRKIFFIIVILITSSSLFAQNAVSDAIEQLRLGNNEKAFKIIDDYILYNPTSTSAHYTRALVYADQKNYRYAITDLNMAIFNLKLNDVTDADRIYGLRGNIKLIMGQYKASLSDLNAAVKRSPDNKEYRFNRAEVLFRLALYKESDKDFEYLISQNPLTVAAHIGMARNAIYTQNYEKAYELLDGLLKKEPRHLDAYRYRALAGSKTGNDKQALDDVFTYYKIMKDSGKGDPTFVYRFLAQYYDASIPIINSNIETLDGEEKVSWIRLRGEVNAARGSIKTALEDFRTIESISFTDRPSTLYSIGYCCLRLDDLDQAERYLKHSLDFRADNNTLLMLGRVYCRQGNLDNALAIFDNLATVKSQVQESALIWKGYVEYIKGDSKKGTTTIKKMFSKYVVSDDSRLLLYEAQLYKNVGKKANADKLYRKILDNDTIANVSSQRQFALAHLGESAEATQWMAEIIKNSETSDEEIYFAASRLHSLIGDIKESKEYLVKAFNNGFCMVSYIMQDPDFENLRNAAGFDDFIVTLRHIADNR